jgi:glutamate synthase (NADPH/NADH) small chain
MIHLVQENKINEAGEMLFENNPLSVICGIVCPHESFCEGHCILDRKGNPIHVGTIENYVSDYYLDKVEAKVPVNQDKKVAIIGSGPAGLAASILLAREGFSVTIFESHEKIGGILRYGIPEFRLPKSLLDRYATLLEKLNVKVRPNTVIGPVLTLDDLFRDGYKAIFVATGTWKPRKLNIPGESLGHVFYAIDYLRSPETHLIGKTIAVIGGGNVALDSARTAVRHGVKEVVIFYRRRELDMPSSVFEIKYAKLDGVRFEFNKAPLEITDEGLVVANTELEIDENGIETLSILEKSKELFKSDSIIISISQGPQANIVRTARDMKLDRLGLVITDDSGKTSKKGVFAAGDVVTGAKTVVEAVAATKIIVEEIKEFVNSKYSIAE